MTEAATEIADRVYKLRPERGDVIAVHIEEDVDYENPSATFQALAEGLRSIAQETGALFVVLPPGTRLEQLDDSTMAAGGWIRVQDGVMQGLAAEARRREQTDRRVAQAATKAAYARNGSDDAEEDEGDGA